MLIISSILSVDFAFIVIFIFRRLFVLASIRYMYVCKQMSATMTGQYIVSINYRLVVYHNSSDNLWQSLFKPSLVEKLCVLRTFKIILEHFEGLKLQLHQQFCTSVKNAEFKFDLTVALHVVAIKRDIK